MMKKIKFLAAICCVLALFTACGKNSHKTKGVENGHEWVDLGLPSGLKWATCNVGAAAPECYGNYYAWGETESKTTYKWNTYKWGDMQGGVMSFKNLTKYNTDNELGTVDNKTILDPKDDIARTNWGGTWRMPTDEEWTELRENCAWKFTNDYNGTGIAGVIVTGFNGNSIFLPAAGGRGYDAPDMDLGIYWSSSLDTVNNEARIILFQLNKIGRTYWNRCCGQSVRPVLK